MGKIIVHKKGYNVKPHISHTKKGKVIHIEGHHVLGSTFKIKDRGAKGRGKKVFPPLKKGSLGVDFSTKAETRHRTESALAKKIGEKKVVGKLRAVQVYNKRTNKIVSRKAKADAHYIASSFVGKKRVPTGTGLRRKR